MSQPNRHESMRGYFAYELHEQMAKNPDIYMVTGDLGYGMLDHIKSDYPERFINVGAAEQAMMGVGVGLALRSKIAVVYSITPFVLYRPFETIRNYVDREQVPVIIVGGGRDRDYLHDGFSHWAEEDRKVMEIFPNINAYWPDTKERIPELLDEIIKSHQPTYLNLTR